MVRYDGVLVNAKFGRRAIFVVAEYNSLVVENEEGLHEEKLGEVVLLNEHPYLGVGFCSRNIIGVVSIIGSKRYCRERRRHRSDDDLTVCPIDIDDFGVESRVDIALGIFLFYLLGSAPIKCELGPPDILDVVPVAHLLAPLLDLMISGEAVVLLKMLDNILQPLRDIGVAEMLLLYGSGRTGNIVYLIE